MRKFSFLLLCCAFPVHMFAQYMSKPAAVTVHQKPLKEVLNQLGRQGGFTFSYNSDIIPGDSMVSIHAQHKPIKQILDELFEGTMEYRERKNHVIIQPVSEWEITGYILDKSTGQRLSDVSIYEPQQLVSSLTNTQGYFRLKLRNDNAPKYITVRRMSYADTSVMVRPGRGTELFIPITAKDYTLDTVVVSNHKRMEDTWFGRAFISSKERIQSINLAGFFVDKPYQVSLVPGVGTHGKMSSQVENKFSFNILGGYSAGVQGVELGGMFNLVKKDVEGAQLGGLMNMSGGKIGRGVQIAGLFNQVLDSVKGLQMAGLVNITSSSLYGAQIAGLYNHAAGDAARVQIAGLMNFSGANTEGTQISGLVNYTKSGTKGPQLAGIANITGKTIRGAQISGVFNYTRKLDGFQLGLINYADSSSGISLGLINIVPHGYHKLSVYTNEVMRLNAAIKSGSKYLYTIWLGGFNPGNDDKAATFGYGLGTDIDLVKWLSVSPEISVQHLYLGAWDHMNSLSRAQVLLNIKINKYLTLFGCPAYNVYYTEPTLPQKGFMHMRPENHNAVKYDSSIWSWVGWSAGISMF